MNQTILPEGASGDLARMLKIAPMFDIAVELPQSTTATSVFIKVLEAEGERVSKVPLEKLEKRLLAELGSKTVRWVYYHPGTSCKSALMALPDARIKRLSQLYQKWKQSGFPV